MTAPEQHPVKTSLSTSPTYLPPFMTSSSFVNSNSFTTARPSYPSVNPTKGTPSVIAATNRPVTERLPSTTPPPVAVRLNTTFQASWKTPVFVKTLNLYVNIYGNNWEPKQKVYIFGAFDSSSWIFWLKRKKKHLMSWCNLFIFSFRFACWNENFNFNNLMWWYFRFNFHKNAWINFGSVWWMITNEPTNLTNNFLLELNFGFLKTTMVSDRLKLSQIIFLHLDHGVSIEVKKNKSSYEILCLS